MTADQFKVKNSKVSMEKLTPDIVSQAGLNLLYGYLSKTGSTGTLAKNAPVLNGRI